MDKRTIQRTATALHKTIKKLQDELKNNTYIDTCSLNSIENVVYQIKGIRENRETPKKLEEILTKADEIQRFLDDFIHNTKANNYENIELPSTEDLICDINSLIKKFKNVEYKDKCLSVDTEFITLENIDLGSFKIKLHLDKYDSKAEICLRIVALNPHPAIGDPTITHPHVRDQRLCEGSGFGSITKSLKEGLIENLFNIVNTILTDYNDESPYVSLDEWYTMNCRNCGEMIEEECSCEGCGESSCSYCAVSCQCGSNLCESCSSRCDNCGETYCQECCRFSNCTKCKIKICDYCTYICVECSERFCNDHHTRDEQTDEIMCNECMKNKQEKEKEVQV